MSKIYYYAQINTDTKICCGVSQLCGEVVKSNMVPITSYDLGLQGKMWTGTWNEETQSWDGGEWIENPNLPQPTTEPTTQDIMDKLNDMSADQVSVATLDNAYREGVNAYV